MTYKCEICDDFKSKPGARNHAARKAASEAAIAEVATEAATEAAGDVNVFLDNSSTDHGKAFICLMIINISGEFQVVLKLPPLKRVTLTHGL